MKTTIDISDPLFEQLREAAAAERTTMRALVERALRLFLQEPGGSFELPDASVEGQGVRPGFEDWSRVREAIYETRGG